MQKGFDVVMQAIGVIHSYRHQRKSTANKTGYGEGAAMIAAQ